jgi:hypothetical protein
MEYQQMLKAFKTTSAVIAVGLFMGGAAFAQTTPAPKSAAPMKMTQAQCSAIWNKLDAAKSGNVSEAQAKPYVASFSAVDTNHDGKLSQTEFQSGCDKGQVHDSATTGTGSGTSGSTNLKK